MDCIDEYKHQTIEHKYLTSEHNPLTSEHNPLTTEHRHPMSKHSHPTGSHSMTTSEHRHPTGKHSLLTDKHGNARRYIKVLKIEMMGKTKQILLKIMGEYGCFCTHPASRNAAVPPLSRKRGSKHRRLRRERSTELTPKSQSNDARGESG